MIGDLDLRVTDASCLLAVIPPDPCNRDEEFRLLTFYDQVMQLGLSQAERTRFSIERAEAIKFNRELEEWEAGCDAYLEYLERNEISPSKQPMARIPLKLWVAGKIDRENSTLLGYRVCFCWVRLDTESMVELYPFPIEPTLGSAVPSRGDLHALREFR
jgi:hypothetical protein